MRQRLTMAGLVGTCGLAVAGGAAAQPIGTFSWQLQPFCNVVTVNVTQNGGVYTLDGFDNQCGAGQRAPLVGLATPNPDGTIGLGLNIVTVPGGLAVHVDARLTLATLGGSWSDSAGNSGTFVFNGPGGGSPRPSPTIPAFTIASGSIGAAQLAPGAVGSAAVADGAIGAADVNSSQVQLQIAGMCPSGEFMVGATPAGAPLCQAWVVAGGTNTALGRLALQSNIGASNNNTAIGQAALQSNSTGSNNTAVGLAALRFATTGSQNVAVGASALANLTTGPSNTAVGLSALSSVAVGGYNVGVGFSALSSTTSSSNTAVGYLAGSAVTTGSSNVLLGYGAGYAITTGSGNIAIGGAAGTVVTTGSHNIHVGNSGVSGDNATIRIGGQGVQLNTFIGGIRGQTPATASPHTVVIGSDGELGSVVSSRRFKDDIADMGDASTRLFALRPVTFRYKQPMRDGSRPIDFGLIAEEVADVFPELATTDQDGVIDGVAYHKLPALLLNELQKQQRTIDALQHEVAELKRLLSTFGQPQ
jgi:Chaperone of endosialidase